MIQSTVDGPRNVEMGLLTFKYHPEPKTGKVEAISVKCQYGLSYIDSSQYGTLGQYGIEHMVTSKYFVCDRFCHFWDRNGKYIFCLISKMTLIQITKDDPKLS